MSALIQPRNWADVESQFRSSGPCNYVVMDDFLKNESCEALRQSLLSHWGWRYKDSTSEHLHNRNPKIAPVLDISSTLLECCPSLFGRYELLEHWAVMYHRNIARGIHSDNTSLVLSLWLTPDECNLNDDTGGLILYDVKRLPNMSPQSHISYSDPEGFVSANTQGKRVVIPYKFNRAVLFDAWTFHKADSLNFATEGAETYRVALALAFDDPVSSELRLEKYVGEA